MRYLVVLAALVGALVLPAGVFADETGNRDEHECELLIGVPHHNWKTIVCDAQVVFVENPSGQITFQGPFVDFD